VLTDQLALLLRHSGVNPHYQVIDARHVGGLDLIALFQQAGEGVGAAGDPVEPGRDQYGTQLPATDQRCQEARPAVVLAAGHVGVFGNQRPALGPDIARTLACCVSSPRPLWPCSAVETR
jgi:hypothetical protein